PAAPVLTGSLPGVASHAGAAPATTPAPAAPQPAAVPAAPAAPATAPAVVPAQGGGGVPVWALVLGISGAAAVALLAQPVSQALAASGGAVAGLRSQLTVHPR